MQFSWSMTKLLPGASETGCVAPEMVIETDAPLTAETSVPLRAGNTRVVHIAMTSIMAAMCDNVPRL